MARAGKTSQLQIRVSPAEKAAIHRAALRAGQTVSTYVLGKLLAVPGAEFQEAVEACAGPNPPSFALAELNALLTRQTAAELREAVAAAPAAALTPYLANYVAAMVEYACQRHGLAAPAWTRGIEALARPVFGSSLQSLRLHLLVHSPPPFRRRNIFVDASLGARV
jgi:hypothetical protein